MTGAGLRTAVEAARARRRPSQQRIAALEPECCCKLAGAQAHAAGCHARANADTDAALLAHLRAEQAEIREQMAGVLWAVERREELLMSGSRELTAAHAAQLQEDWRETERLLAWREGELENVQSWVQAQSRPFARSIAYEKAGPETAEQGGSGGAPVPAVQRSVASKLPDGGAPSRVDGAAPPAVGGPGQTHGGCTEAEVHRRSSSKMGPTPALFARRVMGAAAHMLGRMFAPAQDARNRRSAAAEAARSFLAAGGLRAGASARLLAAAASPERDAKESFDWAARGLDARVPLPEAITGKALTQTAARIAAVQKDTLKRSDRRRERLRDAVVANARTGQALQAGLALSGTEPDQAERGAQQLATDDLHCFLQLLRKHDAQLQELSEAALAAQRAVHQCLGQPGAVLLVSSGEAATALVRCHLPFNPFPQPASLLACNLPHACESFGRPALPSTLLLHARSQRVNASHSCSELCMPCCADTETMQPAPSVRWRKRRLRW
jgi:hypothetical protein